MLDTGQPDTHLPHLIHSPLCSLLPGFIQTGQFFAHRLTRPGIYIFFYMDTAILQLEAMQIMLPLGIKTGKRNVLQYIFHTTIFMLRIGQIL